MFSLSLKSLIILLGLVAIAYSCHPSMTRGKGYCKYYIDGTSDKSGSSSSSGSSGSGEGKRYRRTKKKKDVPCYHYEDGSKDPGATLKPGVAEYTVTVTKTQ